MGKHWGALATFLYKFVALSQNLSNTRSAKIKRSASAQNSHEDDNLIEDLDDASAERPAPILDVSWPLQVAKVDPTISALYQQWRNKVLDLVGEFHPDFVWDIRLCSRLVESVLTRIPLPAFYLSEENDGRTLVIDGEQRLRALFTFYEGKYALEGLNFLPELNGLAFGDLNAKLQRRLDNTFLTCFVFQPGAKPEVKFEIFERLNAGGMRRTAQEMRAGLFPGPGLDMVRRWAHGHAELSLRALVRENENLSRSCMEEVVLRTVAFMVFGVDVYRGSINMFLNEMLVQFNKMPSSALIDLQARIELAFDWTRRVFGEHAFCWYNTATSTWSSNISVSLIDVIICGFDRYFPESKVFKEGIERRVLETFRHSCQDSRFKSAIAAPPNSVAAVKLRFDLWMKALADVA